MKLSSMTDEYIKSLEDLISYLDKKNTNISFESETIDSTLSLGEPLLETLNKIILNTNHVDNNNLNTHNHSQEDFVTKKLLLEKKQDLVKNKIVDLSSNKWNWNIVTGEVLFSSNWCKSLGYECSEIKPHVDSWKNLVHPDDLSQTFSQLNAHFEGKKSVYVVKNRLKMKNGKWRNNIDAGRVVERNEQNNPIRMEGVDISLD